MTTSTPPSSFDSPKRKRDDPFSDDSPWSSQSTSQSIRLDTATAIAVAAARGSPALVDDEPGGSPRTQVAYKFQGLGLSGADGFQLDEGSGTPQSGESGGGEDGRKRIRFEAGPGDESPPKRHGSSAADVPMIEVDASLIQGAEEIGKQADGQLRHSYPSINRLADSTSRNSQLRAGTPPLSSQSISTPRSMFDVDRSQLTWHADEITGHTLADPDDDGTGINGIGFRPTPQVAYSRKEKRKQQMAQYKSREAKEARARRSERRNAEAAHAQAQARSQAAQEASSNARRVRFLDADMEGIQL